MKVTRLAIYLTALILSVRTSQSFSVVDPLPSWRNTAARKAIVTFVEKVTTEGSPDFVPIPARIATFDNDGTLWPEQPFYFELAFALDRVNALGSRHPEWKTQEPFASLLRRDVATLAGGARALTEIVTMTHSGMTTDEFQEIVRHWIHVVRHPRLDRPYIECLYQPMRELMSYLRSRGFKTYIVSGGGIEFTRAWIEEAYGIPPEQVIGSDGEPVAIQNSIGRRPIAAFGNSDGDLQMLQWVASGDGLRLAVLIHHTDREREWSYDRASRIGTLDKALDAAKAKDWTVVDMKKDWKTVFPE